MKKIAFAAAILVSTAAWAQAPSSSVAPDDDSNDPNEMICRTIAETGSRLSRTRVCQTRAQWEAQRREIRQAVDRGQTQRPMKGD